MFCKVSLVHQGLVSSSFDCKGQLGFGEPWAAHVPGQVSQLLTTAEGTVA